MPAHPTSPASPGFFASFRALTDSLLAAAQERIDLLGVEVHEERLRLVQIFIWISAAVFTGLLTVTFGSLTLVYLFWESARLAVLVGLTIFYAGALVAIVIAFRRYLARQPNPFAATLEELSEDRACIQKVN
jgi:uncharacterized membrane protein YqjE